MQFKFWNKTTSFTNQRGMTLLEIIIVITILASLGAILANKVAGAQKKANVKQAKIQLSELMKQLDMYYTDCGHYPSSSEGIAALAPGGEAGCTNWGPEPYIKKVPIDPWGSPYVYSLDNGNPVIMSYGQDKKEGGSGFDKDLSTED